MRTWDENKTAINQLWPMAKFTDEERRLWHDDLHSLDQDLLYDAARNVKRNHDTLYPQLKWMLESYRELAAAKKNASRPHKAIDKKLDLKISDDEDRKMADDFVALVEMSSPSEFCDVERRLLDVGLPKMHAVTAIRVLSYARCRLLGEQLLFSRVTRDGDLIPLAAGAAVK